MQEPKIRHLEMIQGIINRMASNSFALKGWAVTLVAAIFTLSGNTMEINYLIACIPIIVFWGLDSFYLSKERAYRSLYEHISRIDEREIDFSMDVRAFLYNKNTFWSCVVSTTELYFYLVLLILPAVMIVMIS